MLDFDRGGRDPLQGGSQDIPMTAVLPPFWMPAENDHPQLSICTAVRVRRVSRSKSVEDQLGELCEVMAKEDVKLPNEVDPQTGNLLRSNFCQGRRGIGKSYSHFN